MNMRILKILVMTFAMLQLGCGNTKFKANGTAANKSDDVKPEPAPPKECNFDKDFVKLSFPRDIQKCIDEGNIYHFGAQDGEEGKCSKVSTSGFQCNFEELIANIPKGVPTSTIEKARAEGAKLVGCGQKNGGQTVVAQWIYPKGGNDKCDYKKEDTGLIVTSCYKLYSGALPKPPTTPEEKRAAVAACMNEGN